MNSPTSARRRVPSGVRSGGQFAVAAKTEADVSLSHPDVTASTADALAPASTMNRVAAERHVKSLIDDAATAGDPERLDEIASLAAGPGWRGVAYVRSYPSGGGSPECEPTDYVPTKAGATRVAEYALSRLADAERTSASR